MSEQISGFYAWGGSVYQSDIVRACIHPKVKAVGKLCAKHIRETTQPDGGKKIETNPEVYLRFLLEEPNPYMSGQKLQEKLATQLCLNNNAFALIVRDMDGLTREIYPIVAQSVQPKYSKVGELYLQFQMKNGKLFSFPYSDIIHLRQDYNEHDLFGEPLAPSLAPLMQIVTTTDQGIVNAIKNSAVVRWLLKFTGNINDEDKDAAVKKFVNAFLSVENGTGAAAVDMKADAIQVEPKDYVPNALQMDRTTNRILSLFNSNEKIVQSKWTEDEWNAYYEAEIEPVALDFHNEYTRKIFSRKQRGFGNSIVFEASNLQYSSTSTKLNFVQLVDRGAMTPNEWRKLFNFAPIDGGDKAIRRKDTGFANENKEVTQNEN
ncbi:MAG: phage portal protein [Angelakisella sp.]